MNAVSPRTAARAPGAPPDSLLTEAETGVRFRPGADSNGEWSTAAVIRDLSRRLRGGQSALVAGAPLREEAALSALLHAAVRTLVSGSECEWAPAVAREWAEQAAGMLNAAQVHVVLRMWWFVTVAGRGCNRG